MRRLAFAFVLILAGCAGTPKDQVRWGQAEAGATAIMKTLNAYRAPCVDFGADHPGCRIDDETYRDIEIVRAEVDFALKAWHCALYPDKCELPPDQMAVARALAGGDTVAAFAALFDRALNRLLQYQLEAQGAAQ